LSLYKLTFINKQKNKFGFTLVELLVVVAIIAVLAVLAFPNVSQLINKAQGVVCTGRLRNLWIVFSTSLNDGNAWPQLPTNIAIGSTNEQQWWLDYTSNNMGLTARDWTCPTISRYQRSSTNTQKIALINYFPTLFDASPVSPKKWPRMPWFSEMQAAHGEGILSVRTDGSVCPIQDP
jgi:prepilin-type N-terminal cleavage/methylation domain-containing protein